MFSIRRSTPTDSPRIKELGQEFDRTPYMVDPKFANMVDTNIPMMIGKNIVQEDSGIITFVAVLNTRIIGFVSFMVEDALNSFLKKENVQSPKCASILFLVVDPKYRNQSVGSSLLKSCLKYFNGEEISVIKINTDYGNKSALALYQKIGFKVVLNWHIYRIYKDELHPTLSYQTVRGMLLAPSWAEPLNKAVLRRPIPWYYTSHLTTKDVHKFVLDNFHYELKNNTKAIVQKVLYNKILGLSFKHDKEIEAYYALKGSVWQIYDLLESGNRGELLPHFTQYVLSQLPNFFMADLHINASDYDTQRIANQIGMKFVYGGITLIYHMSDTNKG